VPRDNDPHDIGIMSRVSPPLELRVVNLCYDLFEAGADCRILAGGRFYFAVGGVLKFIRDAVLRLSHRAARANAVACELLRQQDFEGLNSTVPAGLSLQEDQWSRSPR